MKEEILEVALKRLKRKMKALQRGQRGALSMNLQLDWNIQLYAFLKLQLKAERQWKLAEIKREPMEPIMPQRSREQLAMLIARSGGWGIWVMKRILKQEMGMFDLEDSLLQSRTDMERLQAGYPMKEPCSQSENTYR